MILLKTTAAVKRFIRKGKRLYDGETGKQNPFLCFRIRRTMEHDGLRVRPLRILDIPLIRSGLLHEDIMRTTGPYGMIRPSCFAVWWWLKKTYELLYCAEVESRCVGFVGLYDLKPGDSAEVTLVIFDAGMRRRGYGSRAFTLVAAALRADAFIKRCIVRVKTDNHPSLCFWTKIGFEVLHITKGIKTMTKDLEEELLWEATTEDVPACDREAER
jgi:RimJ/RimL family protein N-acetyltransferase